MNHGAIMIQISHLISKTSMCSEIMQKSTKDRLKSEWKKTRFRGVFFLFLTGHSHRTLFLHSTLLIFYCFPCKHALEASFWPLRSCLTPFVASHVRAACFRTLSPVSQTRLKPSPRLKCKSELFQLKETCTD